MSKPLSLRVVQLDLARQMETVAFIKGFMDFAAASGFNAVGFYLEGRIRTASFPYPSPEESYSPDEIRELVAYAGERGLDVIPVVSTLGHAGMFLRYPELEKLAETRPPFTGRFGPGSHKVFCPSQPETYDFLQCYLAEVAALFPSPYFHIGCDETWDLRRCEACRQRGGEAEIFRDHLLASHRIVTSELGKRAIFWDDMLFDYPEVLEQLPRDMILACWQYQGHVDPPVGHFLHREVIDLLSEYDRLGFDYLICPADYTLKNAESFTAYAARHRPLGGWLTLWEKHEMTPWQSYPLIGAVGRMWSVEKVQDSAEPLREAIDALFGVQDPLFFEAMQALYQSGLRPERNSTPARFLTEGEGDADYAREGLVNVLAAALPPYAEKISSTSRPIFEEILLSLESEQVRHALCRIYPKNFCGDRTLGTELQQLITRIENIRARKIALHDLTRPGISRRSVEVLYDAYLDDLRSLPTRAAAHGCLRVGFCLPDQYSAQITRISICYAGDEAPLLVAQGVFKAEQNGNPYYAHLFHIERERLPEAIIIETWGYGGQGFTWVEANNACGHFLPTAVDVEQGAVMHPEWLLRHDRKATFAGEPDARISFFDEVQATAIHRFRVTLGQK